jgi:uncharacterized protein YecT (DUF1311 family)
MIRPTKSLVLFALVPALVFAKSIYSGKFDYHEFKTPEQSFAGRTAAEIAHTCDTGDHATNDDLAQCSHMKFNHASVELGKELRAVRKRIARNDEALQAQGEPLALPFFNQAHDSWVKYRDNECYSETYMMGEAAERYIFFWECMATITQHRVKELAAMLKS